MIHIIGIGPGNEKYMTIKAKEVLDNCDVIVGYSVYIDLVKKQYLDKELISTPMRQEVKRIEIAIQKAIEGHNVAVVCSGDAEVYGMASLVYELAEKENYFDIEVIAGITSALSGGAVLGSPLTCDFMTISLSDLLTPMEIIINRLNAAGAGDLVTVLYNPSSKKRFDYLQKACEILLKYKPKDTVCGIVKNIGRDGESAQLLTLEALKSTEVDMFTTVFIGNSNTTIINNKMVTKRGYQIKK